MVLDYSEWMSCVIFQMLQMAVMNEGASLSAVLWAY